MSAVHIRLERCSDNQDSVEYKVQSPDFDERRDWSEIGRLKLNPAAGDYTFEPSLPIRARRFVPPELYKLPEPERERLLASDYKEYGWGYWAMAIHHYAMSLLQEGVFPTHHPRP